jgi:NAD(P) transhydrogenase
MRYDFAILGAGPGGMQAALQASRAGARVMVIDRDNTYGGACVHRATVPSKTLRETALALQNFRQRTAGYFPIEVREDLQVASLMSRKQEVILGLERSLRQMAESAGVEYLHGRGSFESPHTLRVLRVNGESTQVEAAHIVVATGSTPRKPDNIDIDHEHLFDSDSILSMIYLPESLLVLGSGVIATEYATVFASLGVAVTMIDRPARPLEFLDGELCSRLVEDFTASGGLWMGSQSIVGARRSGMGEVEVELGSGEIIRGRKLLCALGRSGNTRGLGLAAAGLEANNRGNLTVNEHFQTAQPHIYAVGDVAGPPALASASAEQGRRAILHALGRPVSEPFTTVPIGVYCIPEMACVGLSLEAAQKQYGDCLSGSASFGDTARGLISANARGMLKLVADPAGEQLLGVHAVGEGAAELVHIGQLAMLSHQPVHFFVDHTFNYPTLAEAYRLAAIQLLRQRDANQSRALASLSTT